MLFSTDVTLAALTIYRYSKARVHIELLFRDAQPFTGLTACQARSQAKLHFPFNANLSAGTLAKLAAHPQNRDAASAFSIASLKRRACNQPLSARISQHVAKGHSLEKSSPDYEELCNYGTIIDLAA